jgi:hypothetical protein
VGFGGPGGSSTPALALLASSVPAITPPIPASNTRRSMESSGSFIFFMSLSPSRPKHRAGKVLPASYGE